jgi:ATP-binding cassette subfamily F protein uup
MVGHEDPDMGFISKKQGLKIGYASQSPEFPDLSLEQVLSDGTSDSLTRARILLSKAQFTDFEANAALLSGGWKKRLDIVRAMMQEPDILLLDEPTNHLDVEGILWLEKFLAKERTAYVIISHDRYFLEAVADKIIELNRCYPQGLLIAEGTLSSFMEHKEEFLKIQADQQQSLAGQVRSEIEWLRKSPKARTTKSESRIKRAYQLMDELSNVKQRNQTTKVTIEFSDSERSTRKLLAGKNLSKSLGGKTLFSGLDITLSPGQRLGIVGKNGTGKTTLLKILAGSIAQDVGTIKYAQDLKLVYFDQHREQLPQDISIKEALSPTTDTVNYRGQDIHVNGWAKKFLFSPDRLNLPISCISGGEPARLLIARLMLQPADILFLDEPTNDLDIQTLEVIEESLKEFSGAVVLISHDRCLMDRLCTQILGISEKAPHYFADYSQWEATLEEVPAPKKETKSIQPVVKSQSKKLSYNEQRELDGMEASILASEEEIAKLNVDLEIESDSKKSLELYHLLGEAQKKLDEKFERWEYLQNRVNNNIY